MPSNKTWLLVTDGARARIFLNEGRGKGLVRAFDNDFAASHAPSRDISADRPGRHAQPGGGKHGVAPRADAHKLEKEKFLKDMAGVLDEGAGSGKFASVVLVAPPESLGILRRESSKRVTGAVTKEVNKDLTHLSDAELQAHLKDDLWL
ncbi:MAG: host attachment protein [Rhodospirillales bacterium]|nr:host attachment protein [Rhodospirillales bacterium]MCW8862891.1 host attachment protein [Rhodospirillales bacterium]MCW8952235.1 host attachment protein [Rhodospirillales bacterium]MCW9039645.1 host attachment protein [Rhodospirillales bacterium]